MDAFLFSFLTVFVLNRKQYDKEIHIIEKCGYSTKEPSEQTDMQFVFLLFCQQLFFFLFVIDFLFSNSHTFFDICLKVKTNHFGTRLFQGNMTSYRYTGSSVPQEGIVEDSQESTQSDFASRSPWTQPTNFHSGQGRETESQSSGNNSTTEAVTDEGEDESDEGDSSSETPEDLNLSETMREFKTEMVTVENSRRSDF